MPFSEKENSDSPLMDKRDSGETNEMGTAVTISLKPVLQRRARSTPETMKERNKSKANRYNLIKDHYRVDPDRRVVLPGVPKHEDDWSADIHDFFNLIILVPICLLNGLNWNWDNLIDIFSPKYSLVGSWTGEWFDIFWNVSFLYILVDLLWVIMIPSCVKSPGTIVKHHIVTMIYMCLPHLFPEMKWCMGVCMSVEVNTWLLIARRVFNKQGLPPWIISLPPLFSIRVKLISIFFYLTWVIIRCIVYPTLLPVYFDKWLELIKEENGSYFNVLFFAIITHTILCCLNYKWSYQLLMSKIRYWRGINKEAVSKGL